MSRSQILRLIIMTISLAYGQVAVYAQATNIPRRSGLPGLGTIMGRVLTPKGAIVRNNIKIRISNFATPGVVNYTDGSGEFAFSGLGAGTYYVQVTADPAIYETITETVNLPPNGRAVLTIYLRERVVTAKKPPDEAIVSMAELDQKVPADAKKEFEKASTLIDKGDGQKAIEHLKRAIVLYPNYLMARYNLGVQYLKFKRFADAAEQLEATINLNAKASSPRLYLGIVLVEQRKYVEAVDQLNHVVAIDSGHATAHLYLGIALLGAGDLPASERELSRALDLGGREYTMARYYIAHVYLKRGDRGRAIKELTDFLEAAPNGDQANHARKLLEKLKSSK